MKDYDYSVMFRGQEPKKEERDNNEKRGEKRPPKFNRGEKKPVQFNEFVKEQQTKDKDGFEVVTGEKRKKKTQRQFSDSD